MDRHLNFSTIFEPGIAHGNAFGSTVGTWMSTACNRAMPNRSRLHELVDSLPEAALAVAQGALEHYQTWPPQRPAQLDAIRKANMDRMRRSMRPGTGGGGGGGAATSWDRAAGLSTAAIRIAIGRMTPWW